MSTDRVAISKPQVGEAGGAKGGGGTAFRPSVLDMGVPNGGDVELEEGQHRLDIPLYHWPMGESDRSLQMYSYWIRKRSRA